jgi:hypothetical protein
MPERWTKSSKKWPKQLIFSQLKSTLNIKEQKKNHNFLGYASGRRTDYDTDS